MTAWALLARALSDLFRDDLTASREAAPMPWLTVVGNTR